MLILVFSDGLDDVGFGMLVVVFSSWSVVFFFCFCWFFVNFSEVILSDVLDVLDVFVFCKFILIFFVVCSKVKKWVELFIF